jgi:uncharacterized protein (DUF2062 family)
MTSLRAFLRRCEAALLTTGESPRWSAASLAVGVLLSFSPLLGLQIAVAFAVAWLFRLNRVLLFVGLMANLPWIAPAYYAATTEAAARLLGTPPPSHLAEDFLRILSISVLSGEFWRQALLLVRPMIWPFVIGSTLAAGVLALVAYSVGLAVASARVARRGTH